MTGITYGEQSVMICEAILIQYQKVRDGQTDR